MAKRKIKFEPPKFYLHYDKKTGEILSVGNEKSSLFPHRFEITYEDADPFISGEYKFGDYLVGNKRTADGNTEFTIVQKTDQGYAFKNNLFEWITEKKSKTDCTVEWNYPDQSWYFSLDPTYKKFINDNLIISTVIFFVTLETDFDFLIRTIPLDVQTLVNKDKLKVPFESKLERDIDTISISSKIAFRSYKLRIVHE
jgi:hypothetical protein